MTPNPYRECSAVGFSTSIISSLAASLLGSSFMSQDVLILPFLPSCFCFPTQRFSYLNCQNYSTKP
uniref:Uncharacterized protein n=1 Tax=Mola mola TaxID=94237 RepID=A0A3Q3X840_MOLML